MSLGRKKKKIKSVSVGGIQYRTVSAREAPPASLLFFLDEYSSTNDTKGKLTLRVEVDGTNYEHAFPDVSTKKLQAVGKSAMELLLGELDKKEAKRWKQARQEKEVIQSQVSGSKKTKSGFLGRSTSSSSVPDVISITPRSVTTVFGVPIEEYLQFQQKFLPHLKVPQFFHDAAKYIITYGLHTEGIFRLSGAQADVIDMKDRIDRGEIIQFEKENNAVTAAALIKLYFRDLPHPLIPSSYYSTFLDAEAQATDDHQRVAKFSSLLKEIYQTHPFSVHVLELLCFLLYQVAINDSLNLMNISNVGMVLGPSCLRDDSICDLKILQEHSGRVTSTMSSLIEHHQAIFEKLYRSVEVKKSQQGDDAPLELLKLKCKLICHKTSILAMAVSQDIGKVCTMDSRGILKVWSADTLKSTEVDCSDFGGVFCLHAVKDEIWIGSEKKLNLLSAKTLKVIRHIEGTAYAVCTDPNSQMAIVASDQCILVFDSKSKKVVRKIDYKGRIVFSLCVTQKGQIWAGATDGTIYVWTLEGGLVHQFARSEVHSRRINSLLEVDQCIWSASDDNSIGVINAQTFQLVTKIRKAHNGKVWKLLAFGSQVWSCSWDLSVKLWDDKNYRLVHEFNDYHSDAISCLEIFWSDADACWLLWTGGYDHAVCISKIVAYNSLFSLGRTTA